MKKIIINIICGIAIGAGAILPGISGGVLCVVFGVYQPLMHVLSHPKEGIKKEWKMLLCIAVGWAVGFFAFSNLIKFMFGKSELYATWFFIGLIFGNLPALIKEAGKEGRNAKSFIGMGIGFLVMASILITFLFLPQASITPNFWWFGFAGILWGLSIIIPGMTSSSILMCLGIYEPFNEGLSVLDFKVIIPWVLGMAIIVILLSRAVDKLFKKHYSLSFHSVIGIVIASTLVIVPIFEKASGGYAAVGTSLIEYTWVNLLISAICAFVGFIAAYKSNSLKVDNE